MLLSMLSQQQIINCECNSAFPSLENLISSVASPSQILFATAEEALDRARGGGGAWGEGGGGLKPTPLPTFLEILKSYWEKGVSSPTTLRHYSPPPPSHAGPAGKEVLSTVWRDLDSILHDAIAAVELIVEESHTVVSWTGKRKEMVI